MTCYDFVCYISCGVITFGTIHLTGNLVSHNKIKIQTHYHAQYFVREQVEDQRLLCIHISYITENCYTHENIVTKAIQRS